LQGVEELVAELSAVADKGYSVWEL